VVLIVLGIVLVVLLALRAVETWQGRGSPDAFQIGSFAVRWYGILLMTGAFCGALLGEAEARRRGLNPDHVWNILLLGLVLGVTVSRLWYVWETGALSPAIFSRLSALKMANGSASVG